MINLPTRIIQPMTRQSIIDPGLMRIMGARDTSNVLSINNGYYNTGMPVGSSGITGMGAVASSGLGNVATAGLGGVAAGMLIGSALQNNGGMNLGGQSFGSGQNFLDGPQQGYNAPQNNYNTGQGGYGAPQNNYGSQPGYGGQQPGYHNEPGYGNAPQSGYPAQGQGYGAVPPASSGTAPSYSAGQGTYGTAASSANPAYGGQQPGYGYQQSGYGNQTPSYGNVPQNGYGNQQPGFGNAPQNGYGNQQPGYGNAPQNNFGNQQPGIGTPTANQGAPVNRAPSQAGGMNTTAPAFSAGAQTTPAPPVQKPIPALRNRILKGQKTGLETHGKLLSLKVSLGWNVTNALCDVDVSAFLLNASGKVPGDTWFIFYGQETSPDGSTVFSVDNGEDRESIKIDLKKLDSSVQKIVFVVTINEALEKRLNFSMLKDCYVRLMDGSNNQELVSFMLEEYYPNVTSMMLGEIYLHNGAWKFNAIGNGVARDLAGLCELYGVAVV